MKNLKIMYLALMLMFIMFTGGCVQSIPKQIVFETEEQVLNLRVGDIYSPSFKIENIESYVLEYEYNTDIIKVEDNSIYCLENGKCDLTVSIKDQTNVKPIKIEINISSIVPEQLSCEEAITIFLNQTYQLNINFTPENSSSKLQCLSYDSNVAVGDENGLIKAINEGQTYILVKSLLNPNAKQRVLVTVKKPPVEEIEVIEQIKLGYNQTLQLEWNVLPQEADQDVILESSNPTVASINQSGLITAHKYGTTNITIQSVSSNDIKKTIEVIVDGDKTSDIIIEQEKLVLQLGQSADLNLQIVPSTACPVLDITINNETAIEIIDNRVIAKKEGIYKIIIKSIDDTNIVKEITIEILGDDKPVFVTGDQFEEKNNLSWNEAIDLFEDIRAFDDIDGDLTDKIEVFGEVDNRRYGEYMIEYKIKDSDGNESTLQRVIKVTWDYDVTVIGHAGSYFGVPNSEEAILYAAEVLKYPAIEIDLKQTKDGVFVLSHDPNWGEAILEQINYEDLIGVKHTVIKSAGYAGENLTEEQRTFTSTICTFERYLEICKQYNIIAVIELKTSTGISNWTEKNAPEQSRMTKIMELIKKYDMLNRVVFLSSQELCLNWVKTNGYSFIPCQYLTLSSCENETTYNIVKKYNLDISFNVRDGIKISDAWLEKYRALGCKLAVFTFEEYATYEDIQKWIDRGVDYVTTDWHQLDELNLPKEKN